MADAEIEGYLAQFNGVVRERLELMRSIVKEASPESKESFSYGIIGYKLNDKPLVYIGGFKEHVGFYATPNGHEAFAADFAKYKQGKGSVQFPNSQPLPVELIKRVIAYRKEQVA